ncbi:pseudouridine synthase [Marinicella sp. S1101]|uniref:pseudouridine synthase n=1 Tax=Marinicella marina TaxID=2996016 RepID=UPI002260E5F8|nr:pseudouridine synthase [Marinicella marina]MCX7552863.1 pseudouridine synthase [Marinicella marina]MDJ1139828.1 pseudouridine synthase [Marinicella marina]
MSKETFEVQPTERIQKTLARCGLGSRRQIEAAIKLGQISINRKPVVLGQKLQAGDKITWKNRAWVVETEHVTPKVLMYNKPLSEVTTRQDEKGRKTVFDSLPRIKGQKWLNIGRLDINTTGLLLFTTDGDFANHLMHPSANIDREYACRVFGEVTPEVIENLLNGVELEDGMAKFSDIQAAGDEDRGSNSWFHVAIMEGKNREVRRLWESQNIQVSRLKRVRYGPVFLPKSLRKGQMKELNAKELDILFKDTQYEPAVSTLVVKSVKKGRR